MLQSIRSRLLGLVLATVIPFTALIAHGIWSQWRTDQAAATESAISEARELSLWVDSPSTSGSRPRGARPVPDINSGEEMPDILLRKPR